MKGRIILKGTAEGEVLVSTEPISFYGGVDPDTGEVTDKGHPLEGQSIKGKVLVLPTGKGSTVGSYTIYRLKKNGTAPAAMVLKECDTVIAVGVIISEIPTVDQIEIDQLKTGQKVKVSADTVEIL